MNKCWIRSEKFCRQVRPNTINQKKKHCQRHQIDKEMYLTRKIYKKDKMLKYLTKTRLYF